MLGRGNRLRARPCLPPCYLWPIAKTGIYVHSRLRQAADRVLAAVRARACAWLGEKGYACSVVGQATCGLSCYATPFARSMLHRCHPCGQAT